MGQHASPTAARDPSLPAEMPRTGRLFPMRSTDELRSILNGGKTLAPLVAALLKHPGLAADPAALARETERIVGYHRKATLHVKTALAPADNRPAIYAVLGAAMATLVADAWHQDHEHVNPEALGEVFVRILDIAPVMPEIAFTDDLPQSMDLSLAEGQAFADVLRGIGRVRALPDKSRMLFIGKGAIENFTVALRRDLVERAEQISEAMVVDGNDVQRRIVYKSALRAIAPLYAQALDTELNRLGAELQRMPRAARASYLASIDSWERPILLTRVSGVIDRAVSALYPALQDALTPTPDAGAGAPTHQGVGAK